MTAKICAAQVEEDKKNGANQTGMNQIVHVPMNELSEIFQECVEQNTLVYLPTGAGKKSIAIMALSHFADSLQMPIADGGKRSIFVTNNTQLAERIADFIAKGLPNLKVGVYTRDSDAVLGWSREKWCKEFEDNQVIIAPSSIIWDVLLRDYVKIENINLMIFNAFQNATKDQHPIKRILGKFIECPTAKQPRVIGYISMPQAASVKSQIVIGNVDHLESELGAMIPAIKGVGAFNVVMYSVRPKQVLIKLNAQQPNPMARALAKAMEIMLIAMALFLLYLFFQIWINPNH